MKSFLVLLPLLGALASAQNPSLSPRPACCSSDNYCEKSKLLPADQCLCKQRHQYTCETECSKVGVLYEALRLNCLTGGSVSTMVLPPGPPTTKSSTATIATASAIKSSAECECESKMCIQSWPESCKCAYRNAMECYNKCRREEDKPAPPTCEVEEVSSSAALASTLKTSVKHTVTSTHPPSTAPSALPSKAPVAQQVCGGGRAGNLNCDVGECTNHPNQTTAGIEVDGRGVCAQSCGGFVGTGCPAGQYCYDDPRDDCDPKNGGADCMGLCFVPSEAYVVGS